MDAGREHVRGREHAFRAAPMPLGRVQGVEHPAHPYPAATRFSPFAFLSRSMLAPVGPKRRVAPRLTHSSLTKILCCVALAGCDARVPPPVGPAAPSSSSVKQSPATVGWRGPSRCVLRRHYLTDGWKEQVHFRFDDRGALLEERVVPSGRSAPTRVTFTYDDDRVATETWWSEGRPRRKVSFEYEGRDPLVRRRRLADGTLGETTTFQFDDLGRPATKTVALGASTSQGVAQRTDCHFDANHRLIKVVKRGGATDRLMGIREMQYEGSDLVGWVSRGFMVGGSLKKVELEHTASEILERHSLGLLAARAARVSARQPGLAETSSMRPSTVRLDPSRARVHEG